MKKLLTTLGAVLICSTSAASVVSCGAKDDESSMDISEEYNGRFMTYIFDCIRIDSAHYAKNSFDKINFSSDDGLFYGGRITPEDFSFLSSADKFLVIKLAKYFGIEPGKDAIGMHELTIEIY